MHAHIHTHGVGGDSGGGDGGGARDGECRVRVQRVSSGCHYYTTSTTTPTESRRQAVRRIRGWEPLVAARWCLWALPLPIWLTRAGSRSAAQVARTNAVGQADRCTDSSRADVHIYSRDGGASGGAAVHLPYRPIGRAGMSTTQRRWHVADLRDCASTGAPTWGHWHIAGGWRGSHAVSTGGQFA